MNVVTLVGNLATDPEVREIGDDKRVAGFLLAVDRPGDGADFVWVAAWDRQAEVCGQFLSKGRRVAVEGRLRSSSWEEEGKKRTKIEVVARNVQFLSPAPDAAAPAGDVPFEAATV